MWVRMSACVGMQRFFRNPRHAHASVGMAPGHPPHRRASSHVPPFPFGLPEELGGLQAMVRKGRDRLLPAGLFPAASPPDARGLVQFSAGQRYFTSIVGRKLGPDPFLCSIQRVFRPGTHKKPKRPDLQGKSQKALATGP